MSLVRPTARQHVLLLPPGTTEVHSEIVIDADTEVRGAPSGTVLHVAPGFSGRAVIVVRGDRVRLHDFSIDGNRAATEIRAGLPPSDAPFSRFTRGNGV